MSGIGPCVVASMMFVGAPVPPEQSPDPLGRGYMGIRVQSSSLIIESVEHGLPAEKAGLKPQDVIVRVGTLEPQVFKQVVDHICSFRPGALVEIEVQRGSERKVFKIKLGQRPAELDQYNTLPNDIPPP
jgi:C-terminal processing protease CtpA/Prc